MKKRRVEVTDINKVKPITSDKESQELVVWSCGYCGKIYRSKEQADLCHSDRTCDTCGKIIGKKDYYINCPECREKIRLQKEKAAYDKAKKMTYEEYEKEFPGYMLFADGEYYYDYESVEGLLDENPHVIVWGTEKEVIKLDAGYIAETFEENCNIEDYEMDSVAFNRLKEFCFLWNEEHQQEVYYDTHNIAIFKER